MKNITIFTDENGNVHEKMSESMKGNVKKTYNVHYSFYLSDSIDIEASSEKEAEEIVEGMINAGEIGNLNEMDIGEQKIWID